MAFPFNIEQEPAVFIELKMYLVIFVGKILNIIILLSHYLLMRISIPKNGRSIIVFKKFTRVK